tara:strand:- start:10473 stop:10751 length:279 start_codon:yes stop_codon:yes gene_type:complete
MADKVEDRLTRIEQKIDKLADAMISLARAEEKILALQDDHDNMRERMNRLSQKLDDLQRSVDANTRTITIINRICWIIIAAGTAAFIGQYLM